MLSDSTAGIPSECVLAGTCAFVGKQNDCEVSSMANVLYSPDFQHPDTGVPICFVWDEAAELLWMEPCETSCEQWDVSEYEYEETSALCKQWGEHACGSPAEANRLIQSRYPGIIDEGVYFSED